MLWDATAGEMVHVLVISSPASALAFSPDGASLAALYGDGELQVWSLL
jgi:hypothetical protein